VYCYTDVFFNYIEAGSIRSARSIVPLLRAIGATSVIDVGCGRGTWLKVWRDEGVFDTVGVDGDYVDRASLAIPPQSFVACDLSNQFDLGRSFAIATCLEVGEHVPKEAARALVESLCRHAPIIAFSAAVPGQGGEHHINEQPLEFWRDLFAGCGYAAFDCIRPQIAAESAVESWYRYNLIVYASAAGQERLPAEARAARVPDGAPLADVSPLWFRLRKEVLRRLPVDRVTQLAVAKHRLVLARSRLSRRGAAPDA
jgi:hypothetical protein